MGMNKVDFVRRKWYFSGRPFDLGAGFGVPTVTFAQHLPVPAAPPSPQLPAGAAQDPYPCLPPGSICLYTKVQNNMCCRLRKHTTILFPADLFSWMSVESDLFLFL